MALSQDEVMTRLKDVLADCLGVDEDEVTPEARLFADLGAESIDVLDIQFRLEKEFGIKIQESELVPQGLLNDPSFVQDGSLTDTGMAELKKRMPHADLSNFDGKVESFPDLFTVDTIARFVMTKTGS